MRERRPAPAAPARCKLVLVGDVQCGKTAMLQVLAKDCYPETYVPTVFENYTACLASEEQRVELSLWDTSGSPYYDNVRPLCYSDSDAVLLCFDVSRPETLDSAAKKGEAFGIPLSLRGALTPSVEDRNPGLLPQHAGAAHRLQDGPEDRPEHAAGALAPETGTHLLRAGLCGRPAAGSRGLPGVLGFHLGEERAQHLPDRVRPLPEQSPPAAAPQPPPQPLQAAPAPPQPLRAHLLHLQEGKSKKLLRHVKGGRERPPLPPTPCHTHPALGAPPEWGGGAGQGSGGPPQ
ncbi:rho-related GTP-binding protein Rho6 isoform X2 [Pyrgilauda ruficollis]|uniref:rho-related GTP-binding protein Rho6 isoform X2 n=1 Tax=Pyrgilauda ruficollis TaxID=221976 RepID=UPI001B862BA8|nr:rho-related GTP-binding protein Rho6 isoform X2 [Pyrgilauda ruficollis]